MDKGGYCISLLIYRKGLCVSVKKNVTTNEIIEFDVLNFFP
jgi:hypothetical protein